MRQALHVVDQRRLDRPVGTGGEVDLPSGHAGHRDDGRAPGSPRDSGIAAFTMRTVAIRSISNDAVQFSGLSSIARALTFETMMSMPPSNSALPVTQAVSASASATSSGVPSMAPPSTDSASCVALTASACRAQNATEAPSVEKGLDRRPADAPGAAGDQRMQPGQLEVHERSPFESADSSGTFPKIAMQSTKRVDGR